MRLIPPLLLELRRRLRRRSRGSAGRRPEARASRFSTSVRLTTPDRRPDRPAPGRAAADTAGETAVGVRGGAKCALGGGETPCEEAGGVGWEPSAWWPGGVAEGGPAAGVGGEEGEGETGVVTHMLDGGLDGVGRRSGGTEGAERGSSPVGSGRDQLGHGMRERAVG